MFSVNQPEYAFTHASISLNENFIDQYNDLTSPAAQLLLENIENEVNCSSLKHTDIPLMFMV